MTDVTAGRLMVCFFFSSDVVVLIGSSPWVGGIHGSGLEKGRRGAEEEEASMRQQRYG